MNGLRKLLGAMRQGAVSTLLLTVALHVSGCASDYRLHEATGAGNEAVVQALVSKGVSLNAPNASGETPLTLAVSKNHVQIIKLLIERGASVDARNRMGNTPLVLAASHGYVDVAKFLLAHGASVDAANDNGDTPLIRAANFGHHEIVVALLAGGADVNAANKDVTGALEAAASNGHINIVKALIAAGADVHTRESVGWPLWGWLRSPVRAAAWKGHVDIMTLLFEAGAKPQQHKAFGNAEQGLFVNALTYDIAAQHEERLGNRRTAAEYFKTAASYYDRTAEAYSPEAVESRENWAAFRAAVAGGLTQAALDIGAQRQAQQQMRMMAPALATSAVSTARQQGTGLEGAQRIYNRDYDRLLGATQRYNRTVTEIQRNPAGTRSANASSTNVRAPTDKLAPYREKQEASIRLAALCKELAACLEMEASEPVVIECLTKIRIAADKAAQEQTGQTDHNQRH